MAVALLGVEMRGESGRLGGWEPGELPGGLVHDRPSTGRYVLTFSPMHDRKDPVFPGDPDGGATDLAASYTSNAILCSCDTGSPQTSPGGQ